jgi:hypothetical protein
MALATGPAVAQGVTVRGVVYDSLHARPLAGAMVSIGELLSTTDSAGRFTLGGVAPGTYRVTAQHDAIDRLGMSAIGTKATVTDGAEPVRLSVPSFAGFWRLECGDKAPVRDTGFVFGTVRGKRGARTVTVSASWIDVVASGTKFSQKLRTLEVNADSAGSFALCGVPTSTGLSLRAVADSLESGSFDVAPMDDERVLRRDLAIFDPAVEPAAMFTGKVVADSGGAGLARANVVLTDLGLEATTDENGAFSFPGLPPGSHRVYARRIGYGEVETAIDVHAGDHVERDITMARLTMLDSMMVFAKPLARDEAMRVFEEHRKVGLGKFLTLADLEKARGMNLSTLVRGWPGMSVPSNPNPVNRDPVSTRGPRSINGGACKIAVYLDGIPVSYKGLHFDEVKPEELAGLEYYAGPATTPVEYASLGNVCGVILMHSRYKTGK